MDNLKIDLNKKPIDYPNLNEPREFITCHNWTIYFLKGGIQSGGGYDQPLMHVHVKPPV